MPYGRREREREKKVYGVIKLGVSMIVMTKEKRGPFSEGKQGRSLEVSDTRKNNTK